MNNLRNRLLAMPAMMVCVVCIVIMFLFNMVLGEFVDSQIEQSMTEFKQYHKAMDNLEEELAAIKGHDEEAETERENVLAEIDLLERDHASSVNSVPTQMMPLGDKEYLEEFATDEERQLAEFYENEKDEIRSESTFKTEIGANTYCLSTAKFKANDKKDSMEYLLYTNISTLNGFIHSVNRMLVLIICISGIVSIIIGLFMTKTITDSLIELREFVEKLRNGEKTPDKEDMRFREIVQLANHVEELSEELTDAQKLQKLIFQNASHELRTPLMSIQGYAEGISTNVLKNHQAAADIIITESKKMSELVDEMLFISRMDEQKLTEDDMTLIELRQIIEDCREEICVIGDKKGVVIIESLDGGKYFIKGEEKQITKAIANVMSNGIRYAEEKLAIRGIVSDGKIVLSVADDGKGISENDLPHVFERFYKGEGGNFGIGLSITKEIIERHGGTITAENNPTKGAVFTITLPAVTVETKEEEQEIGSGITTADDAMLKAVIDSIPEEDRLI